MDKPFFIFIAQSLEALNHEDERTKSRVSMDVARILVRSKLKASINEEVKVKIDDEFFNILLSEDTNHA